MINNIHVNMMRVAASDAYKRARTPEEKRDILESWKEEMRYYIQKHAPQDTGVLRETMIMAIEHAMIVGGEIHFDLWAHVPDYAKYVEKMKAIGQGPLPKRGSGGDVIYIRQWSNPNTIEQPFFNFALHGVGHFQELFRNW